MRAAVWFGVVALLVLAHRYDRLGLLDALPALIAALVGWLFARTLRRGCRPLIARAIAAIEGPEQLADPRVTRYARTLTATELEIVEHYRAIDVEMRGAIVLTLQELKKNADALKAMSPAERRKYYDARRKDARELAEAERRYAEHKKRQEAELRTMYPHVWRCDTPAIVNPKGKR